MVRRNNQVPKKNKLKQVIEVESNKDSLTLYGYQKGNDSTLIKRKIKLDRYDVYAITSFSGIWKKSFSLSLTTVPFKVRPRFKEFNVNAISSLSNVGLNIDITRIHCDRYFASGKKSSHRLYAGVWVAPSVEELTSVTTRDFLANGTTSKQMFVSTALTINYTYNNLTFTFVPMGFDFATSSVGRKWIYNGNRWWGFGIGIEPKFLSAIANK